MLDAAYAAQQATTMKGDLRRRVIVGVQVKQAVQKFTADSIRARGPVVEFEREIVKLRKDLADIRVNRDSHLKEVRFLRRKMRELRAASARIGEDSIIRARDVSLPDSNGRGRRLA